MYERPLLTEQQGVLLRELVRATNSLPNGETGGFMLFEGLNTRPFLQHPELHGWSIEVNVSDLRILDRKGLILFTTTGTGLPQVDVMPEGLEFYRNEV